MAQELVNYETNTRFLGLTGFVDGDYGKEEARIGLAVSDAAGSGGGTSPATITTGVDNSTLINSIDTAITELLEQADPTGTLVENTGTALLVNIVLRPANVARKFIEIQNIGTIEPLWVRFGAAAVVDGSYRLNPGGSMTVNIDIIAQQSVNLISQGSGTNYYSIAIE